MIPLQYKYLLARLATAILCLLSLPSAFSQSHPDDRFWDTRFQAIGINGPAFAVTARNNVIYMAGNFSEAGGLMVRNIVSWNSQTYTWSALGEGIEGQVLAMELVGDNIYVGGSFERAGGLPIKNLARYNIPQKQWSSVYGGVNDVVRVLTYHNGELYVGGDFDTAGTSRITYVARLNPASGVWSNVVNNIVALRVAQTSVSAIAFNGDEMYMGGMFDVVDGVSARNVIRRTGGTWQNLGPGSEPGTTGRVRAFAFRGTSEVFIGGDFQSVCCFNESGSLLYIAQNIVVYNPEQDRFDELTPNGLYSNWNPRGSIYDLEIYGDYLYAVGTFSVVGPTTVGGVARYNFQRSPGAWSMVGPAAMEGPAYGLVKNGEDLVVVGAFSTVGGIAAAHAAIWNGAGWSPLTNIPDNGANGPIYTSTAVGNDLYVGGAFNRAGGQRASNVARWDGTTWFTLGTGVNGQIRSMLEVGGNIYVGGYFSQAGGVAVRNIARWNIASQTWSTVGAGLSDTVLALTSGGGMVYAGGAFAFGGSPSVAVWNGTTWSGLDSGTNGTVRTLAYSNGMLYAGGDFSIAGGDSAARVAQYDPVARQWQAMGTGLTGGVLGFESAYAMVASGDYIYVGGEFTRAGNAVSGYLARWSISNSSWSGIGSGIGKGTCDAVRAIAVRNDSVWVGGDFLLADNVAVNYAALFDGQQWQALGLGANNGVNSQVRSLTLLGNKLYATGGFVATADGFANRVAAFDGALWSPLGGTVTAGLSHWVHAIAFDGNDVYVGGSFIAAGTATANYVIRWNNQIGSWVSLGNGLNGTVRSLIVRDGKLYVGGDFTRASDIPARGIAVWNIAARRWSALGGIINNGVNGSVMAIASYGDRIYLGGEFTRANDSMQARRVVAWDLVSNSWQRLGEGADSTVRALAVAGSNVYAGGDFTRMGTDNALHIARWNTRNGAWQRLGSGVNGTVHALAVKDLTVYMAGDFVVAGTLSAPHIAQFADYEGYFDIVAEGISGTIEATVYSLAYHNGLLYAGGDFAVAGTDSARNIAVYNTTSNHWSALGSGISGLGINAAVYAVGASGWDVYAGGPFNRAGGNPSYFFAHWNRPTPPPSASAPVAGMAASWSVGQPWPNPTRANVSFTIGLSVPGWVDVQVIDATGSLVEELVKGSLESGEHQLSWAPTGMPSGVYYIRVVYRGEISIQRIVLNR